MIIKCNCVHKAQDKLHGQGNRVGNELKSKGPGFPTEYRCTVCEKITSDVKKN